jgi:hypothetical protein
MGIYVPVTRPPFTQERHAEERGKIVIDQHKGSIHQ